jgi:glycosyltransferase involved in cell wall biosynthesis
MVSTYPPTECGIATFTRSLVTALSAQGTQVDVVRAVEAGQSWPAPGVVHGLVTGSSLAATAARLNEYDLVVVQHEYGIYGGEDGVELVALLERLTVPVLTVLHTVLSKPTSHQRFVLQSVVAVSDLLVTMTRTARTRLVDGYRVNPADVMVIPHGAADQLLPGAQPAQGTDSGPGNTPSAAPSAAPTAARTAAPSAGGSVCSATPHRPIVLTWGLLGPGKGIEWGIAAMATLQDMAPRPVYVVAGRTHPRVFESHGERYRDLLEAKACALGIEDDVVFDNDYLDAERLHRLVRGADIVLLPYDSRDQVTSGVLSEAVAAGRPVVSTRFPHAVELLDNGAGLLVKQRDPEGIAAALRRILTDPGLAARLSGRTRALAPALSWQAVAGRYLAAGRAISGPGGKTRAAVADVTLPDPLAVLA